MEGIDNKDFFGWEEITCLEGVWEVGRLVLCGEEVRELKMVADVVLGERSCRVLLCSLTLC